MIPKLRNMTSLYLVRETEVLCLYRMGSRVANNKYIGTCGGHFEEAELNDPADYIRQKHSAAFDKFTREDLPDGRIVYSCKGTVCYIYEFTEI